MKAKNLGVLGVCALMVAPDVALAGPSMGSYIPTISVKADQITEATMRMLDGPGGSPHGQAIALQHEIDASMRLIERLEGADTDTLDAEDRGVLLIAVTRLNLSLRMALGAAHLRSDDTLWGWAQDGLYLLTSAIDVEGELDRPITLPDGQAFPVDDVASLFFAPTNDFAAACTLDPASPVILPGGLQPVERTLDEPTRKIAWEEFCKALAEE